MTECTIAREIVLAARKSLNLEIGIRDIMEERLTSLKTTPFHEGNETRWHEPTL